MVENAVANNGDRLRIIQANFTLKLTTYITVKIDRCSQSFPSLKNSQEMGKKIRAKEGLTLGLQLTYRDEINVRLAKASWIAGMRSAAKRDFNTCFVSAHVGQTREDC